MRTRQGSLPALVAAWGLVCGSMALAQGPSTARSDDAGYAQCSMPGARAASAESLAGQSGHGQYAYYQERQNHRGEASPFRDETDAAPLPDEGYTPPVPGAHEPADTAAAKDAANRAETGCGCSECDGGCARCERSTCCRKSSDSSDCSCGSSWSLAGCHTRARRFLSGLTIGGWLDQGVTVNGRRVADRFNGPVTFNDRDGEYQMNQFYLYGEKKVDTGGYGWDIGGRVDGLYGTDWRFAQTYGLETDWNESERFYGAAMPQLYADVAVNDLTVRMGHFYSIIGYETVMGPSNFFYSHSYMHQYGEPFTHTGVLASHSPNEQWTLSAGFDRGWDKWEDDHHALSFLGGVKWKSPDERLSAAVAVTSGPYDDAARWNRTLYSLVVTYQVSSRLQYVIEHDYGIDDNGGFPAPDSETVPDAEWYGIDQYLRYDINKCWALGARLEWFRDDDGTRVAGLGSPHGWTGGPIWDLNIPGYAGNFYEMTLGVNWKPTNYINVRPEWRWDWYDGPPSAGHDPRPYDAGTRNSQFTFGTDVIVMF